MIKRQTRFLHDYQAATHHYRPNLMIQVWFKEKEERL